VNAALTPAKHAGICFFYFGGMKGWVVRLGSNRVRSAATSFLKTRPFPTYHYTQSHHASFLFSSLILSDMQLEMRLVHKVLLQESPRVYFWGTWLNNQLYSSKKFDSITNKKNGVVSEKLTDFTDIDTSSSSNVWLGSLMVTCRTCNPEVTQGRRFDSAPGHCRVTTLGKLFAHSHSHVPLSPSSIIWYRLHR